MGRGAPSKMDADVREALVQTAKNVEDEGAILNSGPQIGELIYLLLEALTVVGNSEIALGEGVELDVD